MKGERMKGEAVRMKRVLSNWNGNTMNSVASSNDRKNKDSAMNKAAGPNNSRNKVDVKNPMIPPNIPLVKNDFLVIFPFTFIISPCYLFIHIIS